MVGTKRVPEGVVRYQRRFYYCEESNGEKWKKKVDVCVQKYTEVSHGRELHEE